MTISLFMNPVLPNCLPTKKENYFSSRPVFFANDRGEIYQGFYHTLNGWFYAFGKESQGIENIMAAGPKAKMEYVCPGQEVSGLPKATHWAYCDEVIFPF